MCRAMHVCQFARAVRLFVNRANCSFHVGVLIGEAQGVHKFGSRMTLFQGWLVLVEVVQWLCYARVERVGSVR